ncbi:MAG TPA: hypothetical protein VM554_07270 [Acidisarcina sp.]|nr:hypothetical protein [Acidisarcina sp.]
MMIKISLQRVAGLILPLALMVAGCGGNTSSPSNGTFSISPASTTLDTNTQQTFKATLNNGQPANVTWQVANGDTTAGAGSITTAGVYTPPAYLTANSVQVRVTATLNSNTSSSASAMVTVTPGFLQPLSPENSSLTAGSSMDVQGSISEVGAGKINWVVSTTANGSDGGSSLGTLSQSSCQTGANTYTTCSVTYKAPATLPSSPSVYVVAQANSSTSTTPLHILLDSQGVNSSPVTNQNAQTGLVQMGTSGGNNNDYDLQKDQTGASFISDCCGGTLGSLVEDSAGNHYILSNNHVLGESDQARVGDSIVQPGLIDGGCTPYGQNGATVRPVATLTAYVPLSSTQTNVDAAIARVSSTVDTSGAILQIGPLQSGLLTAAPPAGGTGEPLTAGSFTAGSLRVVKSGRTTGLTCSTVESISQNVSVDYFKDCAETTGYLTKTYTNQISIGGNSFSDAGDSGSMVLDASNAQPIGLFYAGGNGFSVASPIGEVLNEVATQAGQSSGSFKVTGGGQHPITCLNYDTNTVTAASAVSVSPTAMAAAQQAASIAEASLVDAKKGILGTATGKSMDSPGEAAVIVYVDQEKVNVPVPAAIGGVRTLVIPATANSVASHTAASSHMVPAGIHLPASVLAPAIAVKEQNWKSLMKDPAFFGVGVSQSHDNPAEASLLVYVDRKKTPRSMPATVGGLRVRYVTMDRFHVTRSKSIGLPHPTSCGIRSILAPGKAANDAPLGGRQLPLQ